MGVAGSGKTTLSREILHRICAVYLDNNHVADAFYSWTRHGPSYEKLRPSFYRALYTIAEENLMQGNSVLLDVPHVKEMQTHEWRNLIKRIVKRSGAKLAIIRCFCSESVLKQRLRLRGEKRDARKLKHWDEFLVEQPIKVAVPFVHLDVDTRKSLSTNTGAAVRFIQRQLRRAAQSCK